MRIRLLIAHTLFPLILVASLPLAAQQVSPFPRATPEEVGLSSEKLDQIGDAVAEMVVTGDVIGAELLIVKDDRTVFHEAYGWSDREERRPVERGSIWSIKSMSKPFAAAAILMLEEEDKLSLDDPVRQYLPGFAGDERTTIRNLLTHTSGYAGLGNTGGFDTLADWITHWAQQTPERPFGEYVYSDFNYAALGYIVELVSGVAVEKFIDERLIEPLGLGDTHASFSPDAAWASRVNSRYRPSDDETGHEKYWTHRQSQEWPFYPAAWGLWSTALDYAEFLTMWMDGGRYANRGFLDESTVEQALKPGASAGGSWSYGHGWFLRAGTFGHGGFDGTFGFAYPDVNAIVVFLTHSRGRSHRDALMNRLGMLAVFEEPGPMAWDLVAATDSVAEVDLPAVDRSRYVGTYRGKRAAESDKPDRVARVREGRDHLELSFGTLADSTALIYHLVPLGDHRFALGQYHGSVLAGILPSRTLTFDVQDDQSTALRVEKDGETMMVAQRTDPQQVDADVARVLADRWLSWNRVPIDRIVLGAIDAGGIEAARARYRELRAAAPDSIGFGDGQLNRLGYRLMNEGRMPEAIAIFEMNVEAHPTAPNPRDSLGEAYLNAGRVDEAVRSYERAVALAEEQNHPDRAAFRARMERVKRQVEN